MENVNKPAGVRKKGKSRKVDIPLPSMQDIADFLRTQGGKSGKREIAKAFRVHGADRVVLKNMLKRMKDEGILSSSSKHNIRIKGELMIKVPAEITGEDSSGNLIARPLNWQEDTPIPQIIIKPEDTPVALKSGDMVMLKTERVSDALYNGVFIRKMSCSPNRMVGLFSSRGKGMGGIVSSVDRRVRTRFHINKEDTLDAAPDSIVIIELASFRNKEEKAKIVKVICGKDAPYAATMISAYLNNLPVIYPSSAVREAEALSLPSMEGREDLRNVPLVTIDGEDARDFDDAIWAEPDTRDGNNGGWNLIVAIADVACFVRPDTAIDKEARFRGNSVYFPDRAIPMLPENITSVLGSLLEGKDRPALVVYININSGGKILSFRFARAMIKSAARLTYNEVEDVLEGRINNHHLALQIANINGAYESLNKARQERGALEIESDEKTISFTDKGRIAAIKPRERLKSFKLVEEFMIAANVAAANVLINKEGMPAVYRTHESPSIERVDELNAYLATTRITERLPASPKPKHFNRLLASVKGTPMADGVSEMVLRTQSRAIYSTENIGHFGLGLENYTHFTSPIRRYADLLVHRALISSLSLGIGGLSDKQGLRYFQDAAEHISFTEQRAEEAERDAEARYVALYMEDKVGQVFSGKVRGVSHAGLFVTLTGSGADAFAPIGSLPNDYFLYDGEKNILIGQKTGKVYKIGDEVRAVLEEAVLVSGGIMLSLLDDKGRCSGQYRKADEKINRFSRFGSRRRSHRKGVARHGAKSYKK